LPRSTPPPKLVASPVPKELFDGPQLRFSVPGEWIDRHGRSVPKPLIRRIAVLRVDYIGDMLIAAPAFALLRRFFPAAEIDLICGPWNVPLARKLAVFDNVYGIRLFSESVDAQSDAEVASGVRRAGVTEIEKLHLGPYDLAIDLRHDADSRVILPALDAQLYAGFGTSREFPFLDIALPLEDASLVSDRPFEIVLSGQNFRRASARNYRAEVNGTGEIVSAKDEIEIELSVTGARSPVEAGLVSEDTRELGVGLRGVTVAPLQDEEPIPGGWAPLMLKPPHRELTLISGWGQPEEWGVWGVGPVQRFRVALPAARGESQIHVDLDLIGHVHRANPEVTCAIRAEGTQTGEPILFLAPENQKTVSFTVPRHDAATTLASDPFRLAPGIYEGWLRLYLPVPVTPDMALVLTLRGCDSGVALMSRSAGLGLLRSGLCEIPVACAVETGNELLSLEIVAEYAAAFEGTRVEMLTLRCVHPSKTNTPSTHMEQRANMLVLRVAMEFSREPPFGENVVAEQLTASGPDLGSQAIVEEIRGRIKAWQAAGFCVVGLAPGCSIPIRTWPRNYFAELGRSLLQFGPVKLLVVGGPAEREDGTELSRELGLDPELHSICGKLGLAELGQVLEPLDLFIGNNTGTTHYAGRVGVRTVGIYAGTNPPREWGPVGENVSWIYRDEACAPCFLTRISDCRYGHVCLRNLLPSDVLPVIAPEVLAVVSRRQHFGDAGNSPIPLAESD
jgi:ADP-heptose:LPS heptosyltransferase